MTCGSAHDLGRALGDLLAVVEDGDPVADAHDDAHVVLDEQDRQPSSSRMRPISAVIVARLDGVHARRRLVEQQQLRLAGQRARDLQPPLVAVGQVAGQLVLAAPQADVVEPAWRPSPATCLLRAAGAASGARRRRAMRAAASACRPARSRCAVMLANRRMFWKVRPMPASTMSFGRALLKMPSAGSGGGRTRPAG